MTQIAKKEHDHGFHCFKGDTGCGTNDIYLNGHTVYISNEQPKCDGLKVPHIIN